MATKASLANSLGLSDSVLYIIELETHALSKESGIPNPAFDIGEYYTGFQLVNQVSISKKKSRKKMSSDKHERGIISLMSI